MFGWLKRLFKKKTVVFKVPKLEPIKKSQKWGVIIPHTSTKSGAETKDNKWNEYDYALAMNIEPFETRDKDGVYGAASGLIERGRYWSLEPHLNAYNHTAKGFEVLVMEGDSKSFDIALKIAAMFEDQFPDRVLRHGDGVKIVSSGDRGYYNLKEAKRAGMQVSILSEAFFIDNPDEWIEPKAMAEFWEKVFRTL